MTRMLMVFAVAAFAFACGDIDDTTPDPSVTGEQVFDLNEEGRTYVVEGARADGQVPVIEVVRRSGDVESFTAWSGRVRAHAGVQVGDGNNPFRTIVVSNPTGEVSEFDAREQYYNHVPDEQGAACPPTCLHCPEDNAFLCMALCTGRH